MKSIKMRLPWIAMRAACPRQPLGAILFAVLGPGAARSPERFASGDAPPICPTTGVFRPHAKICLFRSQGSHRGSVLGRNIAGALDQPRLRRQGNQPATRTPDCRGPHFGRKPALHRILPGITPNRVVKPHSGGGGPTIINARPFGLAG